MLIKKIVKFLYRIQTTYETEGWIKVVFLNNIKIIVHSKKNCVTQKFLYINCAFQKTYGNWCFVFNLINLAISHKFRAIFK